MIRRSQAFGVEPTYGAVGHYLRGGLLISRGRWDEAATELDEGLRASAVGVPGQFLRAYRAYRSSLAARRGDWEAARADVVAVREGSARTPSSPFRWSSRCAAKPKRASGAAIPWTPSTTSPAPGELDRDPAGSGEIEILAARAEAHLAEQARLRPAEVTSPAPAPTPPPPHPRAADARSSTGPASAVAPRDRAPGITSTLAAAEASRRAGRHDPEPWRAALAAARAAGDPYLAAYASWRLAQVVERVAAGGTNAQIAAALGISPRAVGVHASAVLRKLGARRRTEAVDLAQRGGLLGR